MVHNAALYDINSKTRGRCHGPKSGATNYHIHLELSDKEFVVCWMLLNIIPRVFGHYSRPYEILFISNVCFILEYNELTRK